MSAIWGMIHLDNRDVDVNQGIKMEQAMSQYKLDRCLTVKKGNAVFGCGVQYITEESVREQLPYFDEDNKLFYTADCMLDNRKELMDELSLKDKHIPDGALLYQSYRMWGDSFTDHVLGVFSLVIYNGINNTCVLFTDHTGSRSLYYSLVGNTLYFATIFAPMLTVLPMENKKLNEKWIAACEFNVTPVMEFFPGLTPFDNIFRVLAGHSINLHFNGLHTIISKKCYWRLKRRKELMFTTQEEYKELFIKTLSGCIQAVLRSEGNTGITLSSGLDSSSVACVAAKEMESMNKKLYSFTSIPISEYKNDKSSYYITDESDGVKIISEAYPNIEPEYVRCVGKNACTDLHRMVQYLEFPHKSGQNIVWLDEIYERAYVRGCKVVLKAQYGNATISQGMILSRVYNDILHLKFRSAYREINQFCKINKIPRKKAVKVFLDELKKKVWISRKRFKETMVRRELADKYNIKKTLINFCKKSGSGMMLSKRQRLRFLYDMSALTQLGALDTRFGLYHGLIIRDPLKDIRMIELCAYYPLSCFVQNGVERAAVRKYMRGIVPDSILDIVNRRGLQGADYLTRIRMNWDTTQQSILKLLEQPKLLDYIEYKSLEQIKAGVRSGDIINNEEQLSNSLILCSCSEFLNCYG